MDLTLAPRYQELRNEVRSFLEKHRGEAADPESEGLGDRVRAWQRLLVENGYVGRTIPKEYGGFGSRPDLLETLIIEEEFANARLPLGMRNQGIDMFVPTLLHFGTDEQKVRYVGPTIRGEIIWCQGYSEPGSGSDLASLRTQGRLEGDCYVLNGQKIWTSTAQQADMMFALVRTEPDAGKHAGITYLVLPMNTPGIEVRPLKTMTGEEIFNEVFFTDVRVPRANVIAEPGRGWEVGTYTLRFERGMLGRPGEGERLFHRAADILREQGLLEAPVWRDRLMQIQARMLAMKYHGQRLVTAALEKRDPGVSALIVKLNGCQINYDLLELSIDALGERGLLRSGSQAFQEGELQRAYMFWLGMIIGGGTAQIQKNIISEVGLGMPREPKPARRAAPKGSTDTDRSSPERSPASAN